MNIRRYCTFVTHPLGLGVGLRLETWLNTNRNPNPNPRGVQKCNRAENSLTTKLWLFTNISPKTSSIATELVLPLIYVAYNALYALTLCPTAGKPKCKF